MGSAFSCCSSSTAPDKKQNYSKLPGRESSSTLPGETNNDSNLRLMESSFNSPDEKQKDFNLPGKEILNGLHELMSYIEKCLANAIATDKAEENTSGVNVTSDRVTSSINYGSYLLEYVLNRCKRDACKITSDETRKIVIDVLKETSQIHLVAAGLSLVAYVLAKVEDVSTNKKESVQLLQDMYGLAKHIMQSNGYIGQEKLNDAADFIVKGSFFCISRVKSTSLSRFLSSEVDVEEIKSLQSQLGHKYPDLESKSMPKILEEKPTKVPSSQYEDPDADEKENAFDLPQDVLSGLDELIFYIEKWLRKPTATQKAQENTSGVDGTASGRVTSSIKYGKKLLKNVLKRCKKHASKIMSHETRKVVIDVLKEAAQSHWVAAGLSVVAFVLQKVDDASTNKEECVQFLRYMYDLAKHIKQLDGHIPVEKLHDVAEFIFEGSFFCVSRIKSSKLSSFFSSEVDIEKIKSLQSQLGNKYPDLILEALAEVLHRVPIISSPSQGEKPDAVGIEKPILEVKEKLGVDDDVPTRAVVIHGIGGMGKTILARAVFHSLDVKAYRYCRIFIKQDCSDTDLRDLQQQILEDLFGKNLNLPNYERGQEEICDAFRNSANQPLFLFIDNALRGSDLAKLLPKDLSCMPTRSRMLVTTRILDETDMLHQRDIITRLPYPIKSLPPAEAKKLLSKKVFGNSDATFDSSLDIDGLVTVCGGIPFVLDLVGSRLRKHSDNLSALNSTIRTFKDSLARGERELTEKVVDVVYDSLQSDRYRDAFLDISAFFSKWERRRVSYAVGEDELVALQDAALIKINYGRVELHDIVLTRGRNMRESERITGLESLTDILKDPEKLKKVKGIWLPATSLQYEEAFQLQAEDLDTMQKSLRVLCLTSGTKVTGLCTRKFENLRCLFVRNNDCSPMQLNRLPRLAIFEGRIRSDDRFRNLPHTLRSLKVRGSESVRLDGNFEDLSLLEEVELSQGALLQNLPHSFGEVKSLKKLTINKCPKLSILPDNFGHLKSLEVFQLTKCEMLRNLPNTFGELSNLKKLQIEDCKMLSCLSDTFGQLNSLEYLKISKCESLQRLSNDFRSLKCVAAVDASGCPVLEGKAVDQMIELQSLIMLRINDSPMLIKRWTEIKWRNPLLVSTGSPMPIIERNRQKEKTISLIQSVMAKDIVPSRRSAPINSLMESVMAKDMAPSRRSATINSLMESVMVKNMVPRHHSATTNYSLMQRVIVKDMELRPQSETMGPWGRFERMLVSEYKGHQSESRTRPRESVIQKVDEKGMYKDSISRALFYEESRLVNVTELQDWSSIIPAGELKFAFLVTCCDLCSSTNEETCEMVKKKIAELSCEGFRIMYVGLMEQSEESIGETLRHLSQGISGGASLFPWIPPSHRWKQLFGYSACVMVTMWYQFSMELVRGAHTFIARARFSMRPGKPLVQNLELIFPVEKGEERVVRDFEGGFTSLYSRLIDSGKFLNIF